jgi:urease accessory protein
MPRCHSATPEIVFLNTSGGLTGGDRLTYSATLGEHCRAIVTTQTAERAYASNTGKAKAEISLTVGPGAHLDWLPQETILFNASALNRTTTINLAHDATCLFLETVVLGRHAMGETLRSLHFSDHRTICREGRPIWVEPLKIDDDVLGRAGNATILGFGRVFCTLVLISPNADVWLSKLRDLPTGSGLEVAHSAFDGKLICRVLGTDSWTLRRYIASALQVMRPNSLPRVWQL